MTKGTDLVAAERLRQIIEEGWTAEHDDGHSKNELAFAAAAYALEDDALWPWDREWWKPKTRLRNMVRAGALIVAEIDRLLRAEASPAGSAAPPPDSDEPDPQGIGKAEVVVGGLMMAVVAVIIYSVFQLAPSIRNALDDLRTRPPEEEVICVDPEPVAYCSDFAAAEVEKALAAVPPCNCEPGFVLAEAMPPKAVPDYLRFADDLIADMNEAAVVHANLIEIMESHGPTDAARLQAFSDPSWIILRDDFDRRVSAIEGDLYNTWSPSPSTSNNPLLDAHARLLMAYVALDSARDTMWRAVRDSEPHTLIVFGRVWIDNMQDQISLAQTFGLAAMR